MSTTILLVTWIVLGQQPNSYQVQFSNMANCLAARDAIYAEGNKITEEFNRQPQAQPGGFVVTQIGGHPPIVAAVCALQ